MRDAFEFYTGDYSEISFESDKVILGKAVKSLSLCVVIKSVFKNISGDYYPQIELDSCLYEKST